jgi:drug efflux transport system permease protein
MSALRGLLRKEVYHILRDRRTLVVVIMLPVVQVILFGSAIRTDVRNVRLAIVDPAPDYQTIALRSRFTHVASQPIFTLVAVVPRVADLEPLFQSGRAQEAIVFEPGFADDIARSDPARIGIVTDAVEPNTGSLLQAYALGVIQTFEHDIVGRMRRAQPVSAAANRAAGASRPGIVPQVRMRFNPTRESSHLFVPGLMAFVLTIISSLMTAVSLAREKETGTLEALLVSPLRPWQIIVGKVAPYLGIGFLSVLLIVAEARIIFGVPLRGSLLLLLAEGLLFILVSLSLGILISARTSSQRVAMLGALVGTMLPNLLLSGFIFPLESMPAPLLWISNIVPGRWFVTIARSIMLKGVGLEYLWRETLVLAGLAALLLAASTRSFKARLE